MSCGLLSAANPSETVTFAPKPARSRCQSLPSAGSRGPQPLEKAGGEGGIRTLGTLTGTTVFETVLFNRSSTSPGRVSNNLRALPQVARAALLRSLLRSCTENRSFHLALHHLVADARVPLGHRHHAVPEKLLERRERDPSLQRPARERVPHLLRMPVPVIDYEMRITFGDGSSRKLSTAYDLGSQLASCLCAAPPSPRMIKTMRAALFPPLA